jgi:hypothetical protein
MEPTMKLLATTAALMLATVPAFAQEWSSASEIDPFDGSVFAIAMAGDSTLAMTCDSNSIGISFFIVEPNTVWQEDFEQFADLIDMAIAVDGKVLNVDQSGSYAAANRAGKTNFGAYYDPAASRIILLALIAAKKEIVVRVNPDVTPQRNQVRGSTKASETILACLNKQGPTQ